MTSIPPDRTGKFRRVFGKLRIDRSLIRRGEAIELSVDEPWTERCDVLARLVHGSGRTYAQTQVTLDPGTRSIPLGKALNIPSGCYEIVLSPPFAEFHGATRVERRIPVTIAAAHMATAPYGDAGSRRAELLRELSDRGGGLGALARMASGTSREGDLAAIEGIDPEDLPQVFATAVIAPELARTSLFGRLSPQDPLESASAGVIRCDAGAIERLRAHLRSAGIEGSGDPHCAGRLAALAALADSELAGQAEAVIDRIVLSMALRANAGFMAALCDGVDGGRVSEMSAVARLLWGVGSFGGAGATCLALAASGYEAPELFGEIACGLSPRQVRDGSMVAFTDGDQAVATGSSGWHVRFGPDIVACAQSGICAAAQGAVLARMAAPSFGFSVFDETVNFGDRLLARAGPNYLAFQSEQPFEVVPDPQGAGRTIAGGGTVWACQTGHEDRDGSLDDFAGRVSSPLGGTLQTVRGEWLDLSEVDGEPSGLEAEGILVDTGACTIEVRLGDRAVILDFS